jgi:phosphotriesterase-related protein
MTVMTVTGPVRPADLGFTQPHEHVLIDLSRARARWDYEGLLIDTDVAAEELRAYRASGGRSLVEVTTPDLGRDPAGLARVSRDSGVQIVMGTGWYREPYYPELIDRSATQQLAEIMIEETVQGAGDSGVLPGVIGEIGSDRRWISAQEERVFRAAARAQKASNLGLMTHTPPGSADAQLEILREEGVDLRRVAVGHADALMSIGYHRSIARTGAFVSFDLVGQPLYPDSWRCETVVALLREGLGSSILLSLDLCHRSRLRRWGGGGYSYLRDSFIPLLTRSGVSEEAIIQMTVANPRSFLAGE